MKLFSSIFVLSMTTTAAFAAEIQFTQGPAKAVNEGLFDCGDKSRISAVGEIVSEDGTVWTVPAATNFEAAPKAADLYNECDGNKLGSIADLNDETVPLLDAGGSEEFTMYIFADNYFELNVNGKLLAVDPVPFTQFNSNVVRFKANRPLNLAIMAVDWEENLGLGSEDNRGVAYHAGDGGFVAVLKDADGNIIDVTDDTWKAQTFYTAPLDTKECIVDRDSSACSTEGVDDGTKFFAAHWPVPSDWTSAEFDDSAWPNATTYTNKTIGVDNKKAYTNFTSVFDNPTNDAEFVWSSNVVLLRKTIE